MSRLLKTKIFKKERARYQPNARHKPNVSHKFHQHCKLTFASRKVTDTTGLGTLLFELLCWRTQRSVRGPKLINGSGAHSNRSYKCTVWKHNCLVELWRCTRETNTWITSQKKGGQEGIWGSNRKCSICCLRCMLPLSSLVKIQWIIQLKLFSFILCELYLNKTDKIKKKDIIKWNPIQINYSNKFWDNQENLNTSWPSENTKNYLIVISGITESYTNSTWGGIVSSFS